MSTPVTLRSRVMAFEAASVASLSASIPAFALVVASGTLALPMSLWGIATVGLLLRALQCRCVVEDSSLLVVQLWSTRWLRPADIRGLDVRPTASWGPQDCAALLLTRERVVALVAVPLSTAPLAPGDEAAVNDRQYARWLVLERWADANGVPVLATVRRR